jgi:microsomal epoxide hydrolase
MRRVGASIVTAIGLAIAAGPLRSTAAAPALADPAAQSPGGGAAIRPFRVDVPEPVLVDLKERLARARFPDQIDGTDWDYGTSLAYMKELVDYWRTKFDWREQERRLNRFEQFKTNIDGLDVHFVHRRSKTPNAMALMLVHGWPSSFMQFHKVIEPLTDPAAHGGRPEDAFDLVIPSIPGYGFSDKPRQPGHDSQKTAAIFVELMARLGYRRYGVQGADVGYGVVTGMAAMDAAHVVGLHTETCRSGPPPDLADPTAGVPPFELERMRERQAFFSSEETAYQNVQRTKPQTLGFGLDDSPVGQAAWIIEKFRAWSDGGGNVEKQFTKDELLTNITIYWVTKTGSSSSLSYGGGGRPRDQPRGRAQQGNQPRIEVPTACVSWPKDVGFTPRLWNERRFNLKRFTFMPRGGHFGAFEEPQLYVDDVRAFFRDLR